MSSPGTASSAPSTTSKRPGSSRSAGWFTIVDIRHAGDSEPSNSVVHISAASYCESVASATVALGGEQPSKARMQPSKARRVMPRGTKASYHAGSMKIAIVGAGAAGLAMAMRLKRAGVHDFTILERSHGVGGTWHDNRYPGAGCDVPSHLYCFSFAPKPDWQYKFARQPEIESYFQRCVDHYGLRDHLSLGTEVQGAQFADGAWRVRTSKGELDANVLISGTGQLNRPRVPALPGAESFAGASWHSARWNADYDLRGKRVVVVGNGASAAQFVPEIVPHVQQLTLLQRSPAYVFPRKDRLYRGFEKWLFKYVPGWRRAYRSWIYWNLEARFTALEQSSVMGK